MSEEIATAAADLAMVQRLRTEIATAQTVIEGLKRVLGQVQQERDYWRVQAQDVLTELHQVQAERDELRAQLAHADAELAAYAERADQLESELGQAHEQISRAEAERDQARRRAYAWKQAAAGWRHTALSPITPEEIRRDRELKAARAVVEAAGQLKPYQASGDLAVALLLYETGKLERWQKPLNMRKARRDGR